jgi:hypothetical protein
MSFAYILGKKKKRGFFLLILWAEEVYNKLSPGFHHYQQRANNHQQKHGVPLFGKIIKEKKLLPLLPATVVISNYIKTGMAIVFNCLIGHGDITICDSSLIIIPTFPFASTLKCSI